jgi:hypothetical protein
LQRTLKLAVRLQRGGVPMNRKVQQLILASLLIAPLSAAFACEYKVGESKFVDYANCRYGEDSVQVVNLPEDSNWEQCIYLAQAFSPAKLLAVTQDKNGNELLSLNDRSKIGNPCYLTKQRCDKALSLAQQ